MDPAVFFRRKSDLGCVVALDLTRVDPAVLEAGEHEAERTVAEKFHPRRKRTFFGGRRALRVALSDAACGDPGPVGHTPRGAPRLPAPTLGSVSHKDDVAAAIAATRGQGFVGIDIEQRDRQSRTDIRKFVLTDEEITQLGNVTGLTAAEELLLRFSLKEALYKVLDPALRRYVGFHEVEVTPAAGTEPDAGTAEVLYRLKSGDVPTETAMQWHCASTAAGTPYFISVALAIHPHWAPTKDEAL